jgi:hypothetical protein
MSVLVALEHSAIGLLVFVVTNGSLLYAAHLVARRFFAEAPFAPRVAAAGIVFVFLVLTIAQILSAVSLFSRLPAVAACMLVGSLAHRLWGDLRNVTIEIQHVRGWLRALSASRGAVLLCAALLAVFLAAARGLASPPLSWDALMYHLFFAARYVQLGSLAGFDYGPPMMDHYEHFPINGEMMAAWLLLPFGSDLLVGLMSFPFLALGGLAVYGLCREVGARWDEASLAACLVCFSPFLFAYVTTQDVDIEVFAGLMCGVLFAVRYLSHGEAKDAVASCVAVGIAVGAKHTALALSAVLLSTVVGAVFLRCSRRREWGKMAAILFCGVLLAGVAGGRKYITNWRETGNPIYPLQVTVAGHRFLAGSPYTDMIAEGKGFGSRKDDLTQFAGVFNYFPTWRHPTSAGPKFPLVIVLALGSAWFYASGRQRGLVLLLAAYALFGVLVFYAPDDGFPALARRLWPGAASRFLATPFALLVVAAMPAFAALRKRSSAILAVFASFALWDMMMANTTVSLSFPLAVGVGTAAILLATLAVPWRSWVSRPSLPRIGLLVVVSVALLCLLQDIRDGNRWLRYAEFTDVSPIPRDLVEGWRYCDRPEHPRRIALAAGWAHRGQNWFFYPLLGRRLQNTVVHVPAKYPERSLQPGSDVPPDDSFSHAWLQELHRENVDTVFVQEPWPIEESWMRKNSDAFTLLKAGDGFRVYGVAAQ